MSKKRIITLAAGIALAIGLVAGPVTSTGALAASRAATALNRPAVMGGLRLVRAHRANAPAGSYVIINDAHNLCLDAVSQHDGSNGDKVQLWQCNYGPNQYWQVNLNSYNYSTFINTAHGLCLDAASQNITSNGDKVQLWQCNGGLNQLWADSSGTFVNFGTGVVTPPNFCLDAVSQGDGTNGDPVQIWNCNGGVNQHWI